MGQRGASEGFAIPENWLSLGRRQNKHELTQRHTDTSTGPRYTLIHAHTHEVQINRTQAHTGRYTDMDTQRSIQHRSVQDFNP